MIQTTLTERPSKVDGAEGENWNFERLILETEFLIKRYRNAMFLEGSERSFSNF